MKIQKYSLLFFLTIILSSNALGQLDNRAFYSDTPVDSLKVKQFSIHLDQTSFFKNNEYFTKITDGYTLFGAHLIPSVHYQVHPKFRLEVGAFFWKNFGESGFHQIEPVFTAHFHNKSNQLLMGTLDGGLAHQLIEPLYDFENQFQRRLENGFQWKHKSSFLTLDTWVDWRNMIYEYSKSQEQIVGGLRSEIPILSREKSVQSLMIQGTAYHKGGQIDTMGLSLTTWFNGAIGVKSFWNFNQSAAIKSIDFQGLYLLFNDHSNTQQLPFTLGKAIYLNLAFQTKWLTVMPSFWLGENFTTFQGGKLYRSVSSNISHPDLIDKNRRLIILRLLRDFEIAPNLYISARLEPYYDLSNKFWEFSHGLFFTYRGNLFTSKNQHQ